VVGPNKATKQASKHTHTHTCNAVMLVWGSLRLVQTTGTSQTECCILGLL